MSYTVLQLISDAYYTSGIVSREFQQVDGDQVQDGLKLLNEVITDKTIEEDMLPTYTVQYDFTAVPGQEVYFIQGLTRADTVVFFIQDVRFSMFEVHRDAYFGNARPEDVVTLPYSWHQERTTDGTNIFLYFKPDQPYPMQLSGLFTLNQVTINQDLTLVFDPFYISYMKYRLAVKICALFNYPVPPLVATELLKYEQNISNRSGPLDLTMKKISTLTNNGSMNYGQANLGHGWTVVQGK